jgi:polysaccharide pyruvyl transferase WcaK-like protein
VDSGGGYSLTNMGDVAMLQVAVSRIAKLWPHASIDIVTEVPERLSLYCPKARPITAWGRKAWFADRGVFGGQFYRLVPGPVSSNVMELERELRWRWPSLAQAMIQVRRKLRRTDNVEMDTYLDALLGSDLVIISGCGGINDTFSKFAMTGLDVLAMASRRGIRTVMFGQGFGPIRDPKIWARAKAVLPSVDVICLRESRAGLPLLHSLGVSPDRVMTTGDDAIELAYKARAEEPENGIGLNLRVIDYSGVDLSLLEKIRPVLHDAASKHGALLIPVPIARSHREADARSIRQVLAGYDDESDGGKNLDSPLEVIRQIGRCRVVVTGSYHGAVFALSQGIPVVGLAKSAYYVDKFLGLADQFGAGCQIIFLDDEELCSKLSAAIDVAWRSAEDVKAPLLEAARRQIELGHDAYRRAYKIVMAKEPAARSLH